MPEKKPPSRGKQREKNLSRDAYFDEHYFSLPQLMSLAYQVHEVSKVQPESILEIGPGNGFVSSFLKRAGYPVTTLDINPELEPDICAPIDELEKQLRGEQFDLVLCCEVLEHIPFAEFRENIATFRAVGKRLMMSLPKYHKSFGLGGFLRLPKRPPLTFGWHVDIRKEKDLSKTQHFWELNSEPSTSVKAVVSELQQHYENVKTWSNPINPYHVFFYAE